MAELPPISLRPVEAADDPFLLQLYASTRQDELAALPWPEAEKVAFLKMQLAAQDRHFRTGYPGARFQLVSVDDQPAGRLAVTRLRDALHILDVALLPRFRGRGIGTQLLKQCLAEARAAGVPTRLHVEPANRARRLYERLGFRQIGETGIHLHLEHP